MQWNYGKLWTSVSGDMLADRHSHRQTCLRSDQGDCLVRVSARSFLLTLTLLLRRQEKHLACKNIVNKCRHGHVSRRTCITWSNPNLEGVTFLAPAHQGHPKERPPHTHTHSFKVGTCWSLNPNVVWIDHFRQIKNPTDLQTRLHQIRTYISLP